MAVLFAQRGATAATTPPTTRDVLLALGLVAVPLAADHAAARPRLGDGARRAAFGVLIAAGVRARWTIGLLVVAVVGRDRRGEGRRCSPTTNSPGSSSFTDPTHDPQGAAYNINQAHIAIANGGLFGTGLFHGPQTNGGFVPEQQTDFVFSVVGEEFGLVGGVVLILRCSRCCAGAGSRSRATPTAPASSSRSASCAGSPSRPSRTSA